MREFISFECTTPTCKRRNYTSDKNKKAHPERMEVKKFCPFCRKHTVHKEQK